MKRQKRKAKRADNRKNGDSGEAVGSPNKSSRRDFLSKLRYGALAAAAVGGGGWYLVEEVSATIAEHDLSKIGNGTPSVVQIHDTQCALCVALQREARSAMADFEDGELQYLVADIRQPEGRQLAAAHGVGNVTLLLFDARGRRRDVLVGSNTSEDLKLAFRRHVARGRSG